MMFGLPHIFGFQNKIWDKSNAVLIVGRRRQGKSTILAMICRLALEQGFKVFSNYPIDGAFMIPKTTLSNGKVVTDKSFFYDNPLLENSFVLIDEVSNVWNARSWGKWTEDDSDFFNFLGKNNTKVYMVCQYYDTIDLNIKRAIDATWFVSKSIFKNTSIVECDYHDICKVEDLQTRVIDKRYRKVQYEACEIPDGKYFFRRKKWYPYFDTLYKDDRKVVHYEVVPWRSYFCGDQSLYSIPFPMDEELIIGVSITEPDILNPKIHVYSQLPEDYISADF